MKASGSQKVHVAMLGARRHYAVPQIIYQAGMLGNFYTDSYIGNKPRLEAMLKAWPESVRPRMFSRWLGRKSEILPPEKVISFERLGFHYALSRRLQRGKAPGDVGADVARLFNEKVIQQGLNGADAVIGFNGAALEIFRRAKQCGMRCILEQTIAPRTIERELMAAEIEQWPGWQPGLEIQPENDRLAEREEEEWTLADCIICGSAFVRDGLVQKGVEENRCCVVPYGVDLARFKHKKISGNGIEEERPLRVLFAGEVGLRKGAPYLLEALRRIGPEHVQARLAGEVALDAGQIEKYRHVAEFLGAVPRSEMSSLYEWADLFCLPSVCEGSALVTYEALSRGLAVVCTPNAGSVVEDGVDGIIVSASDVESFVGKLSRLVDNKNILMELTKNTENSVEKIGVDQYSTRIVNSVKEALLR